MSFIKKKNLNTKKGKEKWRRNIDVTELQIAIEEENTKKHIEENIKKKLKSKPNFFIDVEPNQALKPKILDPNRFKKQITEPTKKQKKILKVFSKKFDRRVKISSPINESDEETDVWTKAHPKPNISKNTLKEIKIANSLPQGGQSYNPSFKDHKNLLEEIENMEREKNDIKHAISNKVNIKRKRDDPKTEKTLSHQFNLLKKFKKEMNETEKKTQEKILRNANYKAIEERELKLGIVKKPKRLGKNRYQPQIPDFKLSSELSSNLRTIQPEGNLVQSAFDNVFKKNLIETGNPFGAKKKKSSIPRYKYHNTERGEQKPDSDEKILGTSFNIYHY